MEEHAELPLEWVTSRIGDYTDDAVLITEAEPIDRPGPRIVWCNAAFTKMTGYSLQDVMGRTPRFLQGEDTDKDDLGRIRKALQDWKSIRVGLKNYRKDGSAFWMDLGIHPVADDTGWYRYWVAIQREMPERLESEKMLHRTMQVTEGAPMALGLLDEIGQLTFANEYFRRLIYGEQIPPALPIPYEAWLMRGLGPRPEVPGEQGVSDVAAGDWVRRHMSGLMSGLCRVEQMMNGKWHEFRRIQTDGREQLLIGENIDERIALADQIRQLTKLEAMGQLTSGVAHDFNNLLTVILGNAELIEQLGDDPDDRASLLREVVAAALKGRALTQSLLSFARKSHLAQELVEPETMIAQTVGMFRRTAASAISLRIHCGAHLPRIYLDPGLFQNAVLNLLINARAASSSGGEIVVSADIAQGQTLPSTFNQAMPAQVVRIAVQDNGTGMAPDVLARAVEPFFTTGQVGSGLGLSMVHGFALQSGGFLDIQSTEGEGTTVSIMLPAAMENAQDAPADLDPLDAEVNLAGRRILLVEDDRSVATMLRQILELTNAEVTVLETGDDAMRIQDRWHDFDLLISDIVMPGRIQGDVLATLFMDQTRDRPALLLSGNPKLARPLQVSTGASDVLTKPVESAVLLDRVARLIQRASPPGPLTD